MPAYYPVFLDVRDRRCVVIGGGDLGEEKASKLMEYAARVEVIAPEINDTLGTLVDGERLTWTRRQYRAGDLEGAFIAIVADTSNSRLNRRVSEEAKARNVPLNVADVTNLCTWIAPAVVRRGEVILAASTGGASPALARKFREELSGTGRTGASHPVMDYADLAPLLKDARTELARRGIKLNPDHWQACLTDDLVDLVQAGKSEEAKSTLMPRLLIGTECDCADGVCKIWEELLPSPSGNGNDSA